jgi:hypothetical protein
MAQLKAAILLRRGIAWRVEQASVEVAALDYPWGFKYLF